MTKPKAFEFKSGPSQMALAFLESLHQRFAGLLEATLARALQQQVSIKLLEQQQSSFSDWQNQSAQRMANCVMKNAKPRTHMILELSDMLIGQYVNLISGGPAKFCIPVPMPLSNINERIAGRLANLIGADLGKTWKMVAPIDPIFSSYEAERKFLNFFSANERILSYVFECSVAGQTSHFVVNIPYSFVSSFKAQWHKLQHAAVGTVPWTEEISDHLQDVKLKLRVIVGEAELSVEELLQLGVGDVIILDQKADEPLNVLIEGKPKLKGFATQKGSSRAVKIVGKK